MHLIGTLLTSLIYRSLANKKEWLDICSDGIIGHDRRDGHIETQGGGITDLELEKAVPYAYKVKLLLNTTSLPRIHSAVSGYEFAIVKAFLVVTSDATYWPDGSLLRRIFT